MQSNEKSTVLAAEVAKFNNIASSWWDPNGPLKPLITYNTLRVPFIRDGILENAPDKNERLKSPTPLKGYTLLDIGCGGGFLSEGLGKLGATVLGIDPAGENIKVAKTHLPSNLEKFVSYECTSIEDLARSNPNKRFDGVVMSEVIEHVDNPEQFLAVAVELTKKGGSVIVTTPNRTITSYLGVIVTGEYISGAIPMGTHEWNKFITDKELASMLTKNGCHVNETKGSMYNILTNSWSWSMYKGITYLMHAIKK